MRKIVSILIALVLTIAAGAQTLKITTNSGTKEYQASQVTESQPATFTGGNSGGFPGGGQPGVGGPGGWH